MEKATGVLLEEAVKLKTMSLEKEPFQNLKCDLNGPTTKVVEKMNLLAHNKHEEKKNNKLLKSKEEYNDDASKKWIKKAASRKWKVASILVSNDKQGDANACYLFVIYIIQLGTC